MYEDLKADGRKPVDVKDPNSVHRHALLRRNGPRKDGNGAKKAADVERTVGKNKEDEKYARSCSCSQIMT